MAVTPLAFRLRRVGGQVQVGKEGLPRTKARDFGELRLLDLDDQVDVGKDLVGRAQGGSGGDIGFVVAADAVPRAPFDPDAMTALGQLGHSLRGEANAVFVVLHFLRNANEHEPSSSGVLIRA